MTHIHQVWENIPAQLSEENEKFIFGAVKKRAPDADFEKAIQWLCDAGIVYKVEHVSKPQEPHKFCANSSAFKIYLLDVGLLVCMIGTRSEMMLTGTELFSEFKGAFTENYVLLQIISLEKHDEMDKNNFYFSKDSSTQEVDFVVQGRKRLIPTELKAEENVQAKSLRVFVSDDHKDMHLKGLRLSMKPYKDWEWMENLPLFCAEAFFTKEGLGTDDNCTYISGVIF